MPSEANLSDADILKMQKQQAVADKKVAEEAEKAAQAIAEAVCTKCTELEA